MDLEDIDASTQQNPEQMNKEFTITAYPNVQENLKLPTEDQFFVEKPQEEEPEKTNAESEVQSMVMVPIHQDTSSVPPMTTLVIDLTVSHLVSTTVHAPLPTSTASHNNHNNNISSTTTTSTTTKHHRSDPRDFFQHECLKTVSYEALEESPRRFVCMRDKGHLESDYSKPTPYQIWEEAHKRQERDVESPTSAPQSMAWTTSDTRYESVGVSRTQELSPTDSVMQDDSIPDEQVHLVDDEDSRNDTTKWLYEKKRTNWRHDDFHEPVLLTSEQDRVYTSRSRMTNPEGDQVRVDINRTLPLGGPPGHVTIQTQFFFNKDLEYLRYGSKGSSPALSISKMKATSYPDFGLELLVPEQIWIDDVCTYDISAKYGISHWWFNQQKFYIDRHDSPSRRKEVRTHMRILSVVRIKAYSRYGYDYLSKIVLRRADFQEHTIAKKDFKNLYPSDFEDLNLLLLQGHLDHLLGSDKRMLSTAVKL
ncbi:hypothetical protein Tco_1415926 [Tanacetum coccineum]